MQENFYVRRHKPRGLMDAIRASAVKGVPRTDTSDTSPCLPHKPTLPPATPIDFPPILSPPPLTKPISVSHESSLATDPRSLCHACIREDQHTLITVRDGEEDRDISLKDLSQKLQEFAKARDWEKYHTPRNLLLAMVGEVGELSEIFQWKGEVKRGLEDWEESEKEHLGEELSDVLLYLIRLADICGIDLGHAAQNKILKNAIKYPLPPPHDSSTS
ncbi:uncharacterized protein LOC143611117 [Bidens hawaiensis]|uniref:uncharacterized protein LOC143611117 n=1 Tax=Bidens hawaiensis TaxID=980011 RepID=UPI00404AB025